MKKYITIVMLAGLGIILFYLSSSAWGSLKSDNGRVMIYLEEPIGIKEADRLTEQMEEAKAAEQPEKTLPQAFCIWGQAEDVLLMNTNLNKSTLSDAVLLCGNPELVLEDCRAPVKNDKEGCIIDEETAWELFGNSEAIDKEVTYNGQKYFVRKVIKSREKVFAFQADPFMMSAAEKQENGQKAADVMFHRITLQKPEELSVRETKLVWDNQTGIAGKVLDMELLCGISGICVLLVPVTLCICFLIGILRQYREQTGLIYKGTAVIAALLFIGMLLLLIIKWVEIPLDYIPTKWSDFSFWTELWKAKVEAVKLLWVTPKTDVDYMWAEDFCRSVGCGGLSEMIFIKTLKNCLHFVQTYDNINALPKQ